MWSCLIFCLTFFCLVAETTISVRTVKCPTCYVRLLRCRLVKSGVIQRDVEFYLVELVSPREVRTRAADGEGELDAIYGAVVLEIDLYMHFLRSEIGDDIRADEQPGLPVEIELFRMS